jgi:thimet oligopeptidase
MYAVKDTQTQEVCGHFFLDLHPREGKYGHQCVIPIRPSYEPSEGPAQTSCVAMIANLPRPTAEQPALLRHSQVDVVSICDIPDADRAP